MKNSCLKKIGQLLVTLLLCATTSLATADEYTQNTDPADDTPKERAIDTLVTYLGNLGKFLGYNLETTSPPEPNSDLLTYAKDTSNATSLHKTLETLTFYSVFAAIPVNAFESALQTFTREDYAALNKLANTTFLDPSAYNQESSQDSISVVKNIDQKTYQNDPVNQAALNIINTPDPSFCTSSDSHCLSQATVLGTILKDISTDDILPGTDAIFTYDNAQKFLSQLNSNTLLAPLLYTSGGGGGGGGSAASADKGLPTGSQEQQAADFVRYATGGGIILDRISRSDYDTLWTKAYPITNGDIKKSTEAEGMEAQKSLQQYLTALRIYTAQSSVATSNVYAILSKRMPQQSKDHPTSQALNEFKMATWRLNNPDLDPKNQWLDQINAASGATVQKEIAILLSEINYQMYLTRQQEERILLTNSMILMQALAQNKPEIPSAENAKDQENTTTIE